MKNKMMIGLVLAGVVCAVAAVIFFATAKTEAVEQEDVRVSVERKGKKVAEERYEAPASRKDAPENVQSTPVQERRNAKRFVRRFLPEDPYLGLEESEWKSLTETEQKVYRLLSDTFDENKRKKAIRLVKELQADPSYPDGVSVHVRKLIAENLGWFGVGMIPSMLNCVTDPNQEVREIATESYVKTCCNEQSEENKLALAIVAFAQVSEDPDALSDLFMEINSSNMRNSVAVDTLKQVLESGTVTAKETVQEQINDFTGTDEEDGLLDTPEKLDEWYSDPENQDDPDDEELYNDKA